MRDYPIEKYNFIILEEAKKIIAITHDYGHVVKGVAVCGPEDEFDIDYGKRLAAAKANMKVAVRRKRRAERYLANSTKALEEAKRLYEKDIKFVEDANAQYDKAAKELTQF